MPDRALPALAALLFLLLPRALPAADPAPPFPAGAELAPLEPEGPVERYLPESLWERIDGEAELFLKFGLTAASYRRYVLPGGDDEDLEIGLFELPHSLAAYGLFAVFLPSGAAVEAIGNGAFVDEYQGLLWHGSRFVHVNAFLPAETAAGAIRRALEETAAGLGSPPAPPALLVQMERIVESPRVSYEPRHLLGREIFPPGLESEGDGTFFLATVPAQGTTILAAYEKILENPRRREDGETSYLSGIDPLLGPVTVAARKGRLAGFRSPAPGEVPGDILPRLLAIPFP